MCRNGKTWDEPLPDHLISKWEEWKEDCVNLPKIKIKRCITPQNLGNVIEYQLHHFSDGSSTGYGQCSYVRVICEDGVPCSLIAAKFGVAPVTLSTIPRIELSAAYVSALMSATIKRELQLPITSEYFWTDSQVVLSYINNDARKFHLFVANRLSKIHQLTEVFHGRWRKEYLASLNERKKWNIPRRNIMVGDVVLVKEESEKRMNWPLGYVTKATADDDELVRRVQLRLSNKRSFVERPIQKLVLLVESSKKANIK